MRRGEIVRVLLLAAAGTLLAGTIFLAVVWLAEKAGGEVRGLASLSGVLLTFSRPARRMSFWEQPTLALADWEEPRRAPISLK
jgi:hypothetical protein